MKERGNAKLKFFDKFIGVPLVFTLGLFRKKNKEHIHSSSKYYDRNDCCYRRYNITFIHYKRIKTSLSKRYVLHLFVQMEICKLQKVYPILIIL